MKTIFLNYGTTKEIEKAEKKVFQLYDKYKFVKMEMHGLNQIKITANN
jgi:hypothetical protein